MAPDGFLRGKFSHHKIIYCLEPANSLGLWLVCEHLLCSLHRSEMLSYDFTFAQHLVFLPSLYSAKKLTKYPWLFFRVLMIYSDNQFSIWVFSLTFLVVFQGPENLIIYLFILFRLHLYLEKQGFFIYLYLGSTVYFIYILVLLFRAGKSTTRTTFERCHFQKMID